MQTLKANSQQGNVLLCVLCTILIVSVIGANVLLNSVTRFNTASSQLRGWKESTRRTLLAGGLIPAAFTRICPSRSDAMI